MKEQEAEKQETEEKWWSNELFDADPDCEHHVVSAKSGGVKCLKCRGWFCF